MLHIVLRWNRNNGSLKRGDGGRWFEMLHLALGAHKAICETGIKVLSVTGSQSFTEPHMDLIVLGYHRFLANTSAFALTTLTTLRTSTPCTS